MDILSILGPLWLLILFLQILLTTVDLNQEYSAKILWLKILIWINWIFLMTTLFLLEGDYRVKVVFSILMSISLYYYYKSMRFCQKCAYPLSRTIFKKKFCPKCGVELGNRSKDV